MEKDRNRSRSDRIRSFEVAIGVIGLIWLLCPLRTANQIMLFVALTGILIFLVSVAAKNKSKDSSSNEESGRSKTGS
jgi:membrane protein implicated in regulation of membrane protease activity